MTMRSAAQFVALRCSDDMDEYTRAAHDDAPLEVWWQVIEEHPDMRFWVAHNKTVPLEVLWVLARDEDPRVRSMVASKGKLDSGTLAQLATDEDDAVRMSVARHRRTPVEVLRSMLNDPWEDVREMARERLEALGAVGHVPPDT